MAVLLRDFIHVSSFEERDAFVEYVRAFLVVFMSDCKIMQKAHDKSHSLNSEN